MAPISIQLTTEETTLSNQTTTKLTTEVVLMNYEHEENDINYWLVVGTPLIFVFVIVMLLIALLIYTRIKKSKCPNIEEMRRNEEDETCFDNKVYAQFITLDAFSSSHDNAVGNCATRLLGDRRRSASCPAWMQHQIDKMDVSYENLKSFEEENPLDIYIDPNQFTKELHEASRRYKSENDVGKIKVVPGTSQEKFRRSLLRINPCGGNTVGEQFAFYVKFEETDMLYKIPSSIPRYEPPQSKPPVIPADVSISGMDIDMDSDEVTRHPEVTTEDCTTDPSYSRLIDKSCTDKVCTNEHSGVTYDTPCSNVQDYEYLNVKSNIKLGDKTESYEIGNGNNYHEVYSEETYQMLLNVDEKQSNNDRHEDPDVYHTLHDSNVEQTCYGIGEEDI